ncbi:alpha/beta hydrolase [Nonomuraea sp. B12E4]|uniref:alpha/beta fold hydrolase n=1 Tax=Nonomuraea sp. B12E4 TaxID=3153564 RepID=UPI00325F7BE3
MSAGTAGTSGTGTAGAPGSARTAGAAVRFVATDDGARLATSVFLPQEGPSRVTVVLAHGWAAARPMWRPVAERLVRQGHAVVTYDQRGHGASTLGREPIGVRRLAEDLATVLSAAPPGGDAEDVVVAGHSGGGFAAMAYAAADPERAAARLRGLVLLGTAAHGQDTPDGEVKMMGNPLFGWALKRPALGRLLLRQTMAPGAPKAAAEANRRMFADLPGEVRAACFACSRGMDLRRELASVTVPALVLAGDADKIIDPELGEAVAAALPYARFERVPGAGHTLPLEAPGRIVMAVTELADR